MLLRMDDILLRRSQVCFDREDTTHTHTHTHTQVRHALRAARFLRRVEARESERAQQGDAVERQSITRPTKLDEKCKAENRAGGGAKRNITNLLKKIREISFKKSAHRVVVVLTVHKAAARAVSPTSRGHGT